MKRKNKSYKVIVDSNIWISFLIGRHLKGLQYHIDSKLIQIVSCKEQFLELDAVFRKPKIKKHFTKDQIIEFFELLDEGTTKIQITSKSKLCRDDKDNYLVSLAIDSKADFLITGDKDLLDLMKIEGTVVLKFIDFEQLKNLKFNIKYLLKQNNHIKII